MAYNDSMIINKDLRYNDNKNNLLKSRNELSIARLLQYLNIEYQYNIPLIMNGRIYNIDFKIWNKFIEVIDSKEDLDKFNYLKDKIDIFGIGNGMNIGNNTELGSIFTFNNNTELGSIFIEDPSLSFDYAHILPSVKKCSVLHGHTSSIIIEIIGNMNGNLVIDFGEAKRLIKETLLSVDHKFIINKRYIIDEINGYYKVLIDGPGGRFSMDIPDHAIYIIDGEATVENIGREILRLLMPKMPSNIDAIGIYIYEGVSKGAHLISMLYNTRDG